MNLPPADWDRPIMPTDNVAYTPMDDRHRRVGRAGLRAPSRGQARTSSPPPRAASPTCTRATRCCPQRRRERRTTTPPAPPAASTDRHRQSIAAGHRATPTRCSQVFAERLPGVERRPERRRADLQHRRARRGEARGARLRAVAGHRGADAAEHRGRRPHDRARHRHRRERDRRLEAPRAKRPSRTSTPSGNATRTA